MRIVPHVVSEQNVITLPLKATTREAIKLMVQHNISAVLILNDRGSLAGIITERDVTRCFADDYMDADNELVGDVMTARPDTIKPSDSAEEALEMMQTNHYRHLPVVDNGRIVGIVSIRDLFTAVRELVERNAAHMEAFILSEEEAAS